MKLSTFLPFSQCFLLGLVLAGTMLLSACSYTTIEPDACTTTYTAVSYKTDVVPVFKANCYRCHDAAHYQLPSTGGGSSGAMNMESFASVSTWTSSSTGRGGVSYMVGCIRQDGGFIAMPFDGGKLSPCDIALIKAWVDAGAKND
ncbi:hypothetical protein E4631_00155 [Hymenobacter sp. UV11]|uniref:hypothetical protein n=1 Tax=Hymenobacter sp. UV11 TaxID=1849735 RepID=UPI00105C1E63|nr:hypothetical protein [Hymenobacter sp. UV11]TFZ68522.1 hypothetical protein E4631_00155 [Hymenobacter sp. UV11]